MRRLQAGLFPEARRRIGKCLDCGEDGAAAGVGEEFGFLVPAGACADAREPLLATKTTKATKNDRARKGMRLNESSAQRIPRRRRAAQMAIGANSVLGLALPQSTTANFIKTTATSLH